MSSRATPTAETWVQRAEATFAAAGHKRGGARRAVVELLDSQQCALTAVEIEDALRGREVDGANGANGTGERRRVSRASVYRILDELERLRLVQRVETGQAMVRYERVSEREHPTVVVTRVVVGVGGEGNRERRRTHRAHRLREQRLAVAEQRAEVGEGHANRDGQAPGQAGQGRRIHRAVDDEAEQAHHGRRRRGEGDELGEVHVRRGGALQRR